LPGTDDGDESKSDPKTMNKTSKQEGSHGLRLQECSRPVRCMLYWCRQLAEESDHDVLQNACSMNVHVGYLDIIRRLAREPLKDAAFPGFDDYIVHVDCGVATPPAYQGLLLLGMVKGPAATRDGKGSI